MEYMKLVGLYEDLIKTTKRLEKTNMLSEFLRRSKSEDIPNLILLMQGKIFPNWDEKKIGVASKLILKAINVSTGISLNKIESEWKKTGDLGNVAENLVRSKQQVTLFSSSLSVKKVFLNLRKLAELEGMGAVERKVKLISELLTSAKPLEAKYVVRTVLEELRVGVGEGSLRDAIVWAFFSDKVKLKYLKDENNIDVTDRGTYNKYIDAVQSAYDLTNDFSIVANTAKSKGLDGLLALQLEVGRPLKVMLALKVLDVDSGFLRCGKPADIEYKLDGFRIQVHKKGSNVRLFTRRLEEVTGQFPEVVRYVKENVKCDSVILDSEAVGFNPKTGKYLPFQKISQRIKRKYDILEMSKKFPVELNVFDIIYYNGESLLKENFSKRRKLIEEVVLNKTRKIVVVRNLVTSDKKDAEKFYRESLSAGNEGVMFKNLESPYKPGARVKHMVKLKPVMDTLDLVIVAAEWGEGKRANWLSSFTIACVDEDGGFLSIGKVGTGIKEKEEEGVSFKQLTEELKPYIIAEKGKGVKVSPKVVVEINYEEIQKSPTYSSGYALRFPRLLGLRLDRDPRECSTLGMVEDYFYNQKK